MDRAALALASLVGVEVTSLTVNSLESEDAPFLGLVVSKLSPIVGNLLERRIVQVIDELNPVSGSGLSWVRQDPGFPDALLVDRRGTSTEAGYEVKAWYALSTELTGRFRESERLLAPRNIGLIVVAWVMSHVVYGTPTIVDILAVDAVSVARARDEHYHQPPDYLCVEPGNTTSRTRNLQQTNVNGYRLQDATPRQLRDARGLVAAHPGHGRPSHTEEAQALALALMNRFPYRLDTNFAKIDRVDHPDIERFKTAVLSSKFRGRPIKDWANLLKDLTNEKDLVAQAQAAAIVQAVYDEL
jgi:hypothetical protein